jgi:hypothetical protein
MVLLQVLDDGGHRGGGRRDGKRRQDRLELDGAVGLNVQ